VGLEPTIPVFERGKTFHALDRAATVIGTVIKVCSRKMHATFRVDNFLEEYRLENRGHEKIKF
jgi:hypothetical protein